MLVAVTGSTGLIGTALVRRLEAEGHQVLRFTRSRPTRPNQSRWDPMAGRIDADAVARADAVVHLAGRGIGDGIRWTRRIKEEILQSRVRGTRLLAETMAGVAGSGGPRVLVCASGVHWYGDRGEEVLTESSPAGGGFLAEVVRQWEAAADPARAAGLRVVHIRNGIVQAAEAPVVARQLPLFRLGLGGRLGSGRQWWSWIALDDTVGLYRHALLSGDLPARLPDRARARPPAAARRARRRAAARQPAGAAGGRPGERLHLQLPRAGARPPPRPGPPAAPLTDVGMDGEIRLCPDVAALHSAAQR